MSDKSERKKARENGKERRAKLADVRDVLVEALTNQSLGNATIEELKRMMKEVLVKLALQSE